MALLDSLYQKSLLENLKQLNFWEDYLSKLQTLDFTVFSDKLKVPVLVPIGSRILMRGELKHTNEITVALGADYFAKCSRTQAEILRQHRIKGAKEKMDILKKERMYLENQISFNKTNAEDKAKEIIEYHTDEEDREWRQKHKENMRFYKQNNKGKDETSAAITDEELWNRLEELELQEDFENEFENASVEDNNDFKTPEVPFIIEDTSITNQCKNPVQKKVTISVDSESTASISKLDLLQKIMDKQNELETQLQDFKSRDKPVSKTEEDLIAKLNEMDDLDELEDEMDRLEDFLENGKMESEEENEEPNNKNTIKRSVSFADEDDSETLEITFSHSDCLPDMSPYNPKEGIKKPSDVYAAYYDTTNQTTSILKKSKYESTNQKIHEYKRLPDEVSECDNNTDNSDYTRDRVITLKDVTEKLESTNDDTESLQRPMSLFKMRRQQKK